MSHFLLVPAIISATDYVAALSEFWRGLSPRPGRCSCYRRRCSCRSARSAWSGTRARTPRRPRPGCATASSRWRAARRRCRRGGSASMRGVNVAPRVASSSSPSPSASASRWVLLVPTRPGRRLRDVPGIGGATCCRAPRARQRVHLHARLRAAGRRRAGAGRRPAGRQDDRRRRRRAGARGAVFGIADRLFGPARPRSSPACCARCGPPASPSPA